MGMFGSGLLNNTIRAMRKNRRAVSQAGRAGRTQDIVMRSRPVRLLRNRNAPLVVPITTSSVVAAQQRAAIRRKTDARIKKYRRQHRMGGLRAAVGFKGMQ